MDEGDSRFYKRGPFNSPKKVMGLSSLYQGSDMTIDLLQCLLVQTGFSDERYGPWNLLF